MRQRVQACQGIAARGGGGAGGGARRAGRCAARAATAGCIWQERLDGGVAAAVVIRDTRDGSIRAFPSTAAASGLSSHRLCCTRHIAETI